MILPGSPIGVLGGGQLGMFFTVAAQKMGYRVVVWDPHPEAPARFVADSFMGAAFNDPKAILSFMNEVHAVTYEWENVPADTVSEIEKKVITRPGSLVLRLLQNRATQKNFLHDHGFPIAPFYCFDNPQILSLHTSSLGLPCIIKTSSSGYDGQGQWHITKSDQISCLIEQLKKQSCPSGWVLEKKIDFQKEISVIVVRGDSGEILTYPIAENIHEQGILRISRVPAKINKEEERQATSLAAEAVGALQQSGVFCVEMFLTQNGKLLINEIAPRPHNSGHYSMDVCSVSQFEQQVRVLCGLPLIAPELFSPAVLVNILGSEIEKLTAEKEILSVKGIRFYDYRKSISKPGRKMGHLLIVNKDAEKAMEQAQYILSLLRDATQNLPL
jgi:5-(carboxyamino)imidazole ribonucleotide synthase